MPDVAMAGGIERSPSAYPGIWVLVVADCVSFGLFFLVFMIERLGQSTLFIESARLLDPRLGLINTLILITGSWLVAQAVAASRRGDAGLSKRRLLAAIVVSSGFAVVKIAEYAGKIQSGITVTTNEFFTFYFALTGIHFVHYLIGMGMLIYLANGAAKGVAGDRRHAAWLESAGIFWHLVDLLWIFLFAMLYLLGVKV